MNKSASAATSVPSAAAAAAAAPSQPQLPQTDQWVPPPPGTKGLDPDTRKKLREYLKFWNKENEFLYRDTGTLQGHGFSLNNVKGCDIYLHDHVSQVTVDKCEDCNVVIGPS